jgi:hypothetical protein
MNALFALTCLLSSSAEPQAARVQTWIRQPAPGITYRMDLETDPMRIMHAVRFDATAKQYWAAPALANEEVYDLQPANGRGTMTKIIADEGGIGGVNGDFFQWGDDPGGDPVGIMVRAGELLSHPGGAGNRDAAVGWGADRVRISTGIGWDASVQIGAKRRKLDGLNEYTGENALVLSTPRAGYAISKGPAKFLVLRTQNPRVVPNGEVRAVVAGFRENEEKVPVPPGTMLLSARGEAADLFRGAKLGDEVTVRVKTTGFNFRRIDEVIGGGPVLLRDGKVTDRAAADKTRHPRTAIGTDAEGNVWYAVIDGRQTMSVGATLGETAEMMKRLGCVEALNLDGGGSSSINLFGLTLNRPSGGVERLVANGIVWHGPTPRPTSATLTIEGADTVKVGETLQLRVNGAPANEVLWSGQGGAWVDQDGLVRGAKAGEATVRALVSGRIVEKKLTVTE